MDCAHCFLHSRQWRGVDAPVERRTGGSSVDAEAEGVLATSQLLHSKSSEGRTFLRCRLKVIVTAFLLLRVNWLTRAHFFRQAVEAGYGFSRPSTGSGAAKCAGLSGMAGARPLGLRRPTSVIFGRAFHVAEAVADSGHCHLLFRHCADSVAGECDCFALGY